MNTRQQAGTLIGTVLLAGMLSWLFTAPYLGNTGLARTPGVILGGTPTPALDDFTPLNASFPGPLLMKQSGFPPFVTYLSWVGTPDGVITATHPDGALCLRSRTMRQRVNPEGISPSNQHSELH